MVEADRMAGDGFERCAAQRAWERLVRRAPTDAEVDALTSAFEDAGRNFRALVRAVVQSSAYRMVEPEET
jgi:hypothetical protein